MKRQYGTCNVFGLTASELIRELRSVEYDANRKLTIKTNAFDYDVDGFAESIQDDDRLFDFDFDGDRIVLNGSVCAKFTLEDQGAE